MINSELLNNLLGPISSISLIAFAISQSVRRLIIERQNGICPDCGMKVGNQLEVHHILPKCRGGSNSPNNLVGLCGPSCNDCHEARDREALEIFSKEK